MSGNKCGKRGVEKMEHWSPLIMMVVAYLMLDASSSATTADTNILNIPSCEQFNSHLYYYCSYDGEQQSRENLVITASHLNTNRISENLCGKYENQLQGDICYVIPLLVLKSDSKGLCFSSDTTISYYTTTWTNISVMLTDNDGSQRYPTQCSSVEASVPLGHYEFDCTSFDQPKEIQFIIRGYNIAIGHWWSATVRAFISDKCSTEMSDTDNELLYLLEIIFIAVYSVVGLMVVFVLGLVFWCCFKKCSASNDHAKSDDSHNTHGTVVVNRWYNFEWCPCHYHTNTVPAPSLPADGTPHQGSHGGLEDTHDNSTSNTTERQHSVSTTDAVSQEASVTTTIPRSELERQSSVSNSTMSRLGVHSPQQDTSPQGTLSTLDRNKRNTISDYTMKRRAGDTCEELQEHIKTTQL